MELYRKVTNLFRQEEPSLSVGLGDCDIVKLSLVSWSFGKEKGFSKRFIFCSCFLSLMVIVVQSIILISVGMGATDYAFCGDIVR